jgi:ABC-type oligopeptide transport system substrate-binding subunit/class 3 adenylate cyclase
MKAAQIDDRLPEGTVTFLFTDIEGSTELLKQLGDQYADLLAQQRDLLREIFDRFDGQEVDTQGDSFFVSFPRATQAVSAAVEVQRECCKYEWPEGVELRLRMGLHTGEPLTWTEGYVGIDVHRAARIAAVGHGGQVLLSATTTPLVIDDLPDGVTLLDLGRHRLKDMRRAERIHQLVIEGLLSEFPPLTSIEALPTEVPVETGTIRLPKFLEEKTEPSPRLFVGREWAMGRLKHYLDETLEGEGQIVFVTGGPGRGKTALLDEFARQSMAVHEDLLVVTGECSAYTGMGDPYAPFREALRMLTGDVEAMWASGRISRDGAVRLWEAMVEVVQDLVEIGPDLIDVFISGRQVLRRAREALEGSTPWLERLATLCDSERNGAGDLEQRNLFEQYTELLGEVAERHGLIIVLDDLQWGDRASINLLFHLGRQLKGSRLMILCAYRPEEVTIGREGETHPLEKVLGEFKRSYGDIWIDLAEEDEEEGKEFIDAYLKSEKNRLSPDFHRALLEHTGGHPLFTVELLRDLQERGDLIQDKRGFWAEGEDLDWSRVPARVEGVIEERIGRLREELRETLTIASVEGDLFTAQVVARVQEVTERNLLKALSRELEKQHRLVIEREKSEIGQTLLFQYQFAHSLFQQYLYNDLGEGERIDLHGEVAKVLEELYGEEVNIAAVQLAHHYSEAMNTEKAIQYLQVAGDQARSIFAYDEANQHYERALTLLRKTDDLKSTSRLLMRLGLSYHILFDHERAHQAYSEGFDVWQAWTEKEASAPLEQAPHAYRVDLYDPITLDPGMVGEIFSGIVVDQLYSGLVYCTPDLDVVPDVADRWEILEQGRKFIFHLRDDVYWSDGQKVTSGDFEFAWKRVLDPETGSPNAGLLADIAGVSAFMTGEATLDEVEISAIDDLTLEVRLESPAPYFLSLLGNYTMYPVPEHLISTVGKEWTDIDLIATNGPFSLESWEKGRSLMLVRNPSYHGKFTGNLEQVHFSTQPDPQVELDMYSKDKLDFFHLCDLPVDARNSVRFQYSDDYFIAPMSFINFLGFNTREAPFDDQRVRQALAMVINISQLGNEVMHGLLMPATGGFVPPGIPGYVPDIAGAHDPDGAVRLFAEAGYPGGEGFPKIRGIAYHTLGVETDYLQIELRSNLGIDVEWELFDMEELLARIYSGPYSIVMTASGPEYPDPECLLNPDYFAQVFGWENEKFREVIQEARHSMDQDARMKLYAQAQEILVDEVPVLPILYHRCHFLTKPWVRKLPTSVMKLWYWKDTILEPH